MLIKKIQFENNELKKKLKNIQILQRDAKNIKTCELKIVFLTKAIIYIL
jgi:hypothetical protein